MRQETLDLIRGGIEALNRRDVEGMLVPLRPDVRLEPLRAVLEGSVYEGHDGLRKWFADMLEDWEDWVIRVDGMEAVDEEHVVVEAHMHARGRGSGVVMDAAAAWLCEVQDGKVARVRFYKDRETALEAI
jgi:ketosteroid isomerase-like protein